MRPGRLHPLGLEAVRHEHDGHVRVQLTHPFHETARAVRLSGHEGVVDEDIGACGELAGVAREDGAARSDRAHALPGLVAAAPEGVDFLVGEIHVVMDHEDACHVGLLHVRR